MRRRLEELRNNRLLRNRNYLCLLSAGTISNIGSRVTYIALMAKVYGVTGNPLDLGVLAVLRLIPGILFAILGGVFIDRYDRKKILIISDLGRAALITMLVFADTLSAIYAISMAVSALDEIFYPARAAYEPSLIEKRDLLTANSIRMTLLNLNLVIGPALGGFLVAATGTDTAFVLDAASYIASTVLILFITGVSTAATENTENKTGNMMQELKEGMSYSFKNSTVRKILFFDGILTFIFSMQGPLFFAFVDKYLGGGARETGIIFSMIGIGGLISGVLMSTAGKRLKGMKVILLATLVDGIAFMMFSLNSNILVAYMLSMSFGLVGTVFMVNVNAILQETVPDEKRGRVFSLFSIINGPVSIASISGCTALAKITGTRFIFVVSSVLEIASSLACLVKGFEVRQEKDKSKIEVMSATAQEQVLQQ